VSLLRRIFRRFGWVHLITLGLLAALIVLRAADPAPLQLLRSKVFDFYQQIEPREVSRQPVAIIDLDEESLNEIGQWPWPRTTLARLVNNLRKLGAAGIAFDIVFAEPDRTSPNLIAKSIRGLGKKAQQELERLPSNDDTFARIIKRSPVVLGQATINRDLKTTNRKSLKATFGYKQPKGVKAKNFMLAYPGLTRNLEVLEKSAPGIGVFTFKPAVDGIVRQVPLVVRVGKRVYPTLSMELLRVATKQKTFVVKANQAGLQSVVVAGLEIPTDSNGQVWMKFAKHDRNLYISAKDILNKTVPTDQIAGHLLFLGTSAAGLLDIKATPVDPAIPGVEVHAQLLQNIMDKIYLNRPGWAIGAEVIALALSGLLLIGLVPFLGSLWTLLIGATSIIGLVAITWWAYQSAGMLLDLIYAAFSVFLIYVVLTFLNYMREERERRQVRGQFSHYLSPDLVNQLADDPSRLTLGGEMKEMTLLFADIRGFTTISEQFDAEGLTRFINRYLTPMTQVILERQGTIDKYMGDCIMAFWNAPIDDPDHAKNGVRSALAMFDESDKMNEVLKIEAEQEGRKYIPLRIGAGLNTGICCVGNMGSDMRFDYSVLGDDVNLAARLEGQSKTYGVNIVLGQSTYEAVQEFACLELDRIQVKGKTVPVDIFCVLGDEKRAQSSKFKILKALGTQMISAYRSQEWKLASTKIIELQEADENKELEVLCELYRKRIEYYQENPPGEGWDGAFIATSK
jgi:adenylate cyclase